MPNILEFLMFIRQRFPFWDGLIALIIITSGLYELLARILGDHILSLAKLFSIPNAEIVAHTLYLTGFSITLFTAVYTWRKLRKVPIFRKNELGILFAPRFPADVEKDVELLLITLKQELKSHQLLNQFAIKRLPPNLSINSAEEASLCLRKSGATTAVWGLLESQNSEKGRITAFSRIHFTFVHQPAMIHPMRAKAIALSMAGRKLHTEDRTLIADRNMMAKDIGIVVRNLIGLALLIDLKWHDAVKVFLPLHAELQNMRLLPNIHVIEGFRMQVGYDLALAITMSTVEQYREFLFERQLCQITPEQCEGWLNNIDQAISLDPQNSTHYLTKAIYHFLLGNCDEAILAAIKAKKLAPKALAIPNFSLAFLYNFIGDHVKSMREYKLGLDKKTSYDKDMISQCLTFIKQCIVLFPDEKQLNLALAFIELNRGSVDDGIQILEKMLADPPTEQKFSHFVREGERLLKEAKSCRSAELRKIISNED